MVSGHLQVKKGYYYAVLSFYDSKTSGMSSTYPPDFPKRETNEKPKRSL